MADPTKNEHWLPVVGYEGFYEVSDHGHVRSLDRFVERRQKGTMLYKGRQLRAAVTRWRLLVVLHRDNKAKTCGVHRLVLEAFVGACPEGMECCHNDGDHTNNNLDNLRWDTHSNNVYDIVRHGRHQFALKTECAQGHRFTPQNTYITPKGSRACRICIRIAGRKHDAKRYKKKVAA